MNPPDVKSRTAVGQHAVLRVAAVQSLERAEGNTNRIVTRARREAEQCLLGRLAQVGNRVIAHVHVADAAACERRAAAPERAQAAVLVEQRAVPFVAAIPRHGAARVLAPLALEPELVA